MKYLKSDRNADLFHLILRNSFFLFVLLVSCNKQTTYADFSLNNEAYYVSLAEACDKLMIIHQNQTNSTLEMDGNDSSLPKIIQKLHSNKVKVTLGVDKNGNSCGAVFIVFGVSREGWGICWQRQDYDRDYGTNLIPWVLTAGREGESKVLFSTNEVNLLRRSNSQ